MNCAHTCTCVVFNSFPNSTHKYLETRWKFDNNDIYQCVVLVVSENDIVFTGPSMYSCKRYRLAQELPADNPNNIRKGVNKLR